MNVKRSENRKFRESKNFFASTPFLTNGLLVIGAAILLLGKPVIDWVLGGRMPEQYLDMLMCITLGLFLASGFFTVKRREVPRPGLESIKGFWAVLQGVLTIVVSATGEVFFLFQIINTLAGK